MQDAVGPGIDPDRRDVAPADDAVAVDHEQGALAGAVLPRGRRRRSCATSPFGSKSASSGKWRFRSFANARWRPDAVDRDPEQLRAEALELRQQLAGRAPAGRSRPGSSPPDRRRGSSAGHGSRRARPSGPGSRRGRSPAPTSRPAAAPTAASSCSPRDDSTPSSQWDDPQSRSTRIFAPGATATDLGRSR